MILNLLEELVEFILVVAALYLALSTFVRWRHHTLSESIRRNRMLIVVLLALAVTAIKVSDEVLDGDAGPVDETVLLYVRANVPHSLDGFFQAVTLTGAGRVMTPLTIVLSVALLVARKRFEALLLGISAAAGALLIYLVKMAVGRARPALWETDWYWGSSFPSGHTLQTAAAASALAICAARLYPKTVCIVVPLGIAWIILVGMSRLVLGVHWPSDVLTAACLGVILPFLVQFVLDRLHSSRTNGRATSPPSPS